jgi:transposase
MFIKKNQTKYKNKTYTNHLLVESFRTSNGPQHKVLCSLGDLSDKPEAEWLCLADKIENALIGQGELFPPSPSPKRNKDFVDGILKKIRNKSSKSSNNANNQGGDSLNNSKGNIVSVCIDKVRTEEHREGGNVHVGVHYWRKLGLDKILEEIGFNESQERLTCGMVINRLLHPRSEHAMPDWIRKTALSDILEEDYCDLVDDRLYRNLDRLYPHRSEIEKELAKNEQTMFNLDQTVYLYDLTSTYFEGQCLENPKAKRGYSRDKRPDCLQVVIGLVLNRDGFPLCHEIFDGNIRDSKTLPGMLNRLDERIGLKAGQTVVVDRGMAYSENLEELRRRDLNYIVASRQSERDKWLADYDDIDDYEEMVRIPSPTNPSQKKSRVRIKLKRGGEGEDTYVLCISDGRREKDKAIREKQEKKFKSDLNKLKDSVKKGRLKSVKRVYERMGRLRERYPRVARYYRIEYDQENQEIEVTIDVEQMEKARRLDGSYLLKSSRQDLTAREVWETYILLTRVENAFRSMKTPLSERPIFHHLERRVDTHIFLCVLAFHLLVAIEKQLSDKGRYTSWATVQEILSSHQVATVILPTTSGSELRIRQDSNPEEQHKELYKLLEVPYKIMKPIKTWKTKNRKCRD